MAITSGLSGAERPRRIMYPVRDGKPMGETDKHVNLIIETISVLVVRYADRPDVYVAGNNFVYWEDGNPKKRLSPDSYVVFGATKMVRENYKSWEEGGRLPSVVFEFTSFSTMREDTVKKRELYERELRVPEYFLFDPKGEYLQPRLQGFRLAIGSYESIELRGERLYSEQLGLDLVPDGWRLRFYDPVAGEWLLNVYEQQSRAEAERLRVEAERERAERAEREVERLRAELEALRKRHE